MHTVLFIVAGLLAFAVLVALLAHFGWSISTQHRDHEVAAGGPVHRRQFWSRRPPGAHAGPVNPAAIPSESIRGQHSDLSAGITDDRG